MVIFLCFRNYFFGCVVAIFDLVQNVDALFHFP